MRIVLFIVSSIQANTMGHLNVILSISLIFSAYGLGIGQIDYSKYEDLLQSHVSSEGQVDYARILRNDVENLNLFLEQLSTADPESMDPNDELAFWINAYNAFTIKLIIDHWPVVSIRDIEGGNPWDLSWIDLRGKSYSLNDIEHEIIRKKFQEPRIHFAVNCAAKSCPPLLNKPYVGALLDDQLDAQTRKFINNGNHNQLSRNSLILSRIFEWYKEDFGDLIGFLKNYTKVSVDSKAAIRFNKYDWSLNN